MIRPEETVLRRPNLESLSTTLETFIDQLLALEFSGGATSAELVFTGHYYTMMKFVIRTIVAKYQRNNWRIKDVTGNRKHMYVLEFSIKDE